MAHTFNPGTWEAETSRSEISLIYLMNSRTAKATNETLTETAKINNKLKKLIINPVNE